MILINILVFLIVLTIIVVLHELGHFYFARKSGILVHEFSVGMGPLIYQKENKDIKYSFRAIPLGGYVAMSGEDINESMISKGQSIGVKINDEGKIYAITLDGTYSADLYGTVEASDLYGKDLSPLYIKLLTNEGKVVEYPVLRNAKYLFKTKKDMLITPHESSFEAKSWWQRFITIFAGPMMNFILSLCLLLIVALIAGKQQNSTTMAKTSIFEKGDIVQTVDGKTVSNFNDIRSAIRENTDGTVDFVVTRNGSSVELNESLAFAFQSFGFVTDVNGYAEGKFLIGNVGGRAKSAGLKAGDIILGYKLKDDATFKNIESWEEMIIFARDTNGGTLDLKVTRGSEEKIISFDILNDATLNELGSDKIGYAIDIKPVSKFDFVHLITYPFTQMFKDMGSMFKTLGLLFNPSSGVGVGDLSGPIGIFSLVENAMAQGFVSLLAFMAFLSVNIGLINLLPIPALDGGRITFLLYEGITRRKPNRKIENTINNIFFMLLIALMIYVAFNDVLRLW